MPFSIVFRQYKTIIIYDNGQKEYLRSRYLDRYYLIHFRIPLSEKGVKRFKKINPYGKIPDLIISIRSAFVIFHDILQSINLTKYDKIMNIQSVLERDKFFKKNQTDPMALYIQLIMDSNTNILHNVKHY